MQQQHITISPAVLRATSQAATVAIVAGLLAKAKGGPCR